MPSENEPSSDKVMEQTTPDYRRTVFNDTSCPQEEMPTSVAQLNQDQGVSTMTFDKVRKFNAFESMLKTHSDHHSRALRVEAEHQRQLKGGTHTGGTNKRRESSAAHGTGEHHIPPAEPEFQGDPGPWDGTYHQTSISLRKAAVAKHQTDLQGDYNPLSDYCHRIEEPHRHINVTKPFNAVFHVDNCLTLQLRAAKEQAGLLSDKQEPMDPHFVALMEKRSRLGRHDWVRALPDTSSKWSNQVSRMQVAVEQEDFNEDGRLEGGPCEYTYRDLKQNDSQTTKFKTFFRAPKAGLGGKNIDSTTPKLLVKTEMELTQAADAKVWARARLVDEAARAYALEKSHQVVKKGKTNSSSPLQVSRSSRRGRSGGGGGGGGGGGVLSRSGGIQIRTSTPFNGSRPVSRMHVISGSRPVTRQQETL